MGRCLPSSVLFPTSLYSNLRLVVLQVLGMHAESRMFVKVSVIAALVFGPRTFTKDMGTRSQPITVYAPTLPGALLCSVYMRIVLRFAPTDKGCFRCSFLSWSRREG